MLLCSLTSCYSAGLNSLNSFQDFDVGFDVGISPPEGRIERKENFVLRKNNKIIKCKDLFIWYVNEYRETANITIYLYGHCSFAAVIRKELVITVAV